MRILVFCLLLGITLISCATPKDKAYENDASSRPLTIESERYDTGGGESLKE